MPSTPLTRAQIYAIRDLGQVGTSAPRIIQQLGLPVGVETVRRILRGESHREVGVGATERPMISNRLQGESRRPGDPAPAYHPPTPPDLAEQLRGLAALQEAGLRAARPSPSPDDAGALDEEVGDPEALLAVRKAALPKSAAELIAEMVREGGTS